MTRKLSFEEKIVVAKKLKEQVDNLGLDYPDINQVMMDLDSAIEIIVRKLQAAIAEKFMFDFFDFIDYHKGDSSLYAISLGLCWNEDMSEPSYSMGLTIKGKMGGVLSFNIPDKVIDRYVKYGMEEAVLSIIDWSTPKTKPSADMVEDTYTDPMKILYSVYIKKLKEDDEIDELKHLLPSIDQLNILDITNSYDNIRKSRSRRSAIVNKTKCLNEAFSEVLKDYLRKIIQESEKLTIFLDEKEF